MHRSNRRSTTGYTFFPDAYQQKKKHDRGETMELMFALLFFAAGIFLFILGLYQEYDNKESEEQEEKSDHLVIIFLGMSMSSFFFGGTCMMFITQWYYNLSSNAFMESSPMSIYQPFSWLGFGLGVFVLLFLVPKILEVGVGEAKEHPE